MHEAEVPTDGVLLRRADRAAGLLANGPALDGHAPDLAGESEVRHQIHALLLDLEAKARRLCEVRGAGTPTRRRPASPTTRRRCPVGSEDRYDSRPDTREHIRVVGTFLNRCVRDLERRAEEHDRSKLEAPEVGVFDEYTPKLRGSTYGSDEYRSFLDAMRPALEHHYASNPHHPEYHAAGVRGMSLLDILEMLCDWKAATLRHADGDIRNSVEINQGRFGYSDELKQILLNTLPLLEESPLGQ